MVEYVSVKDEYEIRLASLLSNVDKDVIIELYQPLIGSIASILYLNLLKQKRNEDEEQTYSIEQLVINMQVPPGTLLNARHLLEGVGLLSTFEKNNGENRSYIFVLYAPRTPKDFFDDILFKGLLIQSVGEKEARRLAKKYQINLTIPKEYTNISASFKDVFNPDFNDPSFTKAFSNDIVGRKTRKLKIDFNYDLFYSLVEENSQIKKTSIPDKDIKEIVRLSALYGASETVMANVYIDCYEPSELPHVDLKYMHDKLRDNLKYPEYVHTIKAKEAVKAKQISSNTELAELVRCMNSNPPAKYLTYCLNNAAPTEKELDVIDSISIDYELPFGVINAIIAYTLQKCDKVLNKKYALSLASTMKREKIETAVDALNFLNNINNRYKNKKPIGTQVNGKNNMVLNEENNSSETLSNKKRREEISDEKMEEIMKTIAEMTGGK